MKYLNFVFLIVALALTSSCTKEDVAISYLDSSQLESIHENIRIEIDALDNKIQYSESYYTNLESTISKVENDGLDYLTSDNNLDDKVLSNCFC